MGRNDIPSLGQSTDDLQDENATGNATTTDLSALLPTNTDIIINSEEFGLDTSGAGLLGGHTKVQDITGIVHGNDEDALIGVDAVGGGLANLLSRGGGEDGTGHRRIQQTLAYIASEGGLVAGATTGNNGDFLLWRVGGTAEDDLAVGIIGQRRV